MSKYQNGSRLSYPRGRKHRAWLTIVLISLLAGLGLFIWSGTAELSGQTNTTPARANDVIGENNPSASPRSLVIDVSDDDPPTPTLLPATATPLAFVLAKPPTVTSMPTRSNTTVPSTFAATLTPTTTAPTPEGQPTDHARERVELALATATREAWPTINPSAFVMPPPSFDQDSAHIWFSRPVEGNNVPSAPYRFGMTYDQRLQPHHGLDIANEPGTPVVAVGEGMVFYAGEDIETLFGPKPDFYGRVVVIETTWRWQGYAIYTLYGHLESINVTEGQSVSSGDILGRIGSSGVALGPHLHFEIRQGNPYDYDSVRNPELWYWPFDGRGILAGRVVDNKGVFMPGTRVNLECSDAALRYVETYWDQFTPPDDGLVENFAISDLPVGTCRVWADLFGEIVEQELNIHASELSTVLLQASP